MGGPQWAAPTCPPPRASRGPAGRCGPAPPGAAPRVWLYLHRACPCVNAARRGLSQGSSVSRSLSAAPGEGWPFPSDSALIYVRTAARRGRPRTAGPATRHGEAAGPGGSNSPTGRLMGTRPARPSPHRPRTPRTPAGGGPARHPWYIPVRHGAALLLLPGRAVPALSPGRSAAPESSTGSGQRTALPASSVSLPPGHGLWPAASTRCKGWLLFQPLYLPRSDSFFTVS